MSAALGKERLAIANPDAVPAGKYAKAALQALGIWPLLAGKLARAENVRAALALVSRGETPFGIVYRTDAMADKGVRVIDTFAAELHRPITYTLALVATSQSAAARALMEYMKSDQTRSTWEKYGFTVLK